MLKEERLKAGLTQQQLAERIGTKKTYISRLENGKAVVLLNTLFQIFDGLGRRISLTISVWLKKLQNSRSLSYYHYICGLIDASTTMEENMYMLPDSEIRRRLGQKIRHLRLRQNFTQTSLAEQAQVSLTTLKRIEKGDISYFDSLMRLLRILGELMCSRHSLRKMKWVPMNISSLSKQARRSSANAQVVTTRPTHNLISRNQNGRYSKSKPIWPTPRILQSV